MSTRHRGMGWISMRNWRLNIPSTIMRANGPSAKGTERSSDPKCISYEAILPVLHGRDFPVIAVCAISDGERVCRGTFSPGRYQQWYSDGAHLSSGCRKGL